MVRPRFVQLPLVPDTQLVAVDQATWYPLALQALETARTQWADRTVDTYAQGLNMWRQWCAAFSEPHSMPPRVEAAVAWAEWQHANGYAASTIRVRLSALSWADQWSRRTPGAEIVPLTQHPLVKGWLRGNSRRSAARIRPARCPTPEELQAVIAACWSQRPRRGPRRVHSIALRDRAMLLFAYYGAMRRDEVRFLRVCDVAISSRCVTITFPRSKTDQTGQGELRDLWPQSDVLMCPMDAWTKWLEWYEPTTEEAPAFPPMRRVGGEYVPRGSYMSAKGYSDLIGYRCADSGINRLSPHSFRAAFATHAAEMHDEGEIAYHGRWKSRTTLNRYVRRGRAWKNNPTEGLSRRRTVSEVDS